MFGLVRGPREGWLTLLLLLLVLVTPGRSLADAAWVDDLGVVPWLAFFSVLLSVVLAKLPVRGVVAHLFSAEIGVGLVATFFAAGAPRGNWEERFLWLGDRIATWLDAAFGGGMSNDGMLFALLMALTAWLLGHLSTWLVFRLHNAWLPVVVCGALLLVNLSYGAPNGVTHFLLFLLAAMLLLTRVTLHQKERDWNRADAEYNSRLRWSSLWGSAALSAGIVALAWAIPTGTVNASVAEQWFKVTEPWQELQTEFDRLFASVGASASKVEGNRFSKTLALKGAIELGQDPVLLVASPQPEYWAAQTYDRYTGQGWMNSSDETLRLDSNDARLAETSLYHGRQDIEQRFKVVGGRTASIFAATSPVKLSLPVYADYFGSLEELAALRATIQLRQGQQYAVVSSVSIASAAELRRAGADYPDWTARYLELPSSPRMRFSPLARVVSMARRVTRDASNPFDKAVALERYLRGFRYETKVASPPPERDAVDWFLFTAKEGYCDYYASAMAVMARSIGMPARIVSGYSTGIFNEQTGLYEVRQENAHSWPELFFPDYGWVRFEPTPSQPVPERPETPTVGSSSSGSVDEGDLDALSFDTTGRDKMLLDDDLDLSSVSAGNWGAGDTLQGTIATSRLVVLGVLLAGVLALWLVLGLLRSRLSASTRAYQELCWLAGLLGRGLQPSHTPGEYARVVCEATPQFRSEVEAVVRCYEEETYGGRRPSGEDLVGKSWRRIRLRLPFHLLRRRLAG